jgi:hypothetical protein
MQTKTSHTVDVTDDADIDGMFDMHDDPAARDTGRAGRRRSRHTRNRRAIAAQTRYGARAHRPRARTPLAAGEPGARAAAWVAVSVREFHGPVVARNANFGNQHAGRDIHNGDVHVAGDFHG